MNYAVERQFFVDHFKVSNCLIPVSQAKQFPDINFVSCFEQMEPSLDKLKSFKSKDVRKWVQTYPELKKYGPAVERENVTGRILLEATTKALQDDLGMNSLHAAFLQGEVKRIIEGEA